MQRVAGHGLLPTPVATPAESTLDGEPAVSDSKEDANQTDSITHDDLDERVHDKYDLIRNELHTDVEDLPRGLGTQWPEWNSPKPKGTSQRLTVPVGSTIMDGTVSLY